MLQAVRKPATLRRARIREAGDHRDRVLDEIVRKDTIHFSGSEHVGIEIETGPEGVVAVYFRLSQAKVAETIESEDTEDVLLDLDSKGNLVGIEMINPATVRIKKLVRSVRSSFGKSALGNLSQSRIQKLQELISAT